jgi:hypothetical protein
MPITIPKTWVSGETLSATDMNSNLNAIKGGVANAESGWWTSGQWIEAKHVVSPFIESTRNATHHVSGWYCSQNSGALFTAGSFISSYESAIANRMIVPKTSIIIPVAHPCTWFYQLWACVETRSNLDATRGNAEIHMGIDGAANTYTAAGLQEEQINKSIASGRTYISTYNYGNQTTPADLQLSISAFGVNASSQLVSWGFTVECFYI